MAKGRSLRVHRVRSRKMRMQRAVSGHRCGQHVYGQGLAQNLEAFEFADLTRDFRTRLSGYGNDPWRRRQAVQFPDDFGAAYAGKAQIHDDPVAGRHIGLRHKSFTVEIGPGAMIKKFERDCQRVGNSFIILDNVNNQARFSVDSGGIAKITEEDTRQIAPRMYAEIRS